MQEVSGTAFGSSDVLLVSALWCTCCFMCISAAVLGVCMKNGAVPVPDNKAICSVLLPALRPGSHLRTLGIQDIAETCHPSATWSQLT